MQHSSLIIVGSSIICALALVGSGCTTSTNTTTTPQAETPTAGTGNDTTQIPAPSTAANNNKGAMTITTDNGMQVQVQTEPVQSNQMAAKEPATKEFSVTAKNWEFSPSTITVNQGDKVKLSIKSVDVTHGFALPDFGINENLAPGKTVNVEFTADKKGTFTFFCSVFCGQGHKNMKGQLIVQ